MSNLVTFNNREIELINYNGQLFLTKGQIALVLEYADESQISKLYNAHKSEFTDDMTRLIAKGRTRVRIFNREGAWLIGMFARTPKAAEFRKWVLEVLGNVADKKAILPTINTGDDFEFNNWKDLIAASLNARCAFLLKEEKKKLAHDINALLLGEEKKPVKGRYIPELADMMRSELDKVFPRKA